jgi:hypothetical protein
MKTSPNQDWIDRSNAETLYHLERQGRTGPGLVPFIGAGLSTAFGFKNWRNLLLSAAPPTLLRRIENQLNNNRYEEAAEILLKKLGADGFQNMVAGSAGDSHLAPFDFGTGAVSLLPLLASGPVVTTNFDRVLERAFEINRAPFESIISGPRPDLIVDALHGNRRVLIKLHGDWQDRVGRTFAQSDYNTNYGKSQPKRKRELLQATEELLFSSRSMLFIGASLGPDRTVRLLKAVHEKYAGIRHFAIMPIPKTQKSFNEKEEHLRTYGVLPLWYRADKDEDHVVEVEKLVTSIVERISVQTITKPVKKKRNGPLVRAKPNKPFEPIIELDAHFGRVVQLIKEGRLTFFLGSAITEPVKFRAKEFYGALAHVFECEALKEDHFAVAQYIADRHGRENLYREISKLFAGTRLEPQETHELFAAWPEFKTDAGKQVPFPTIITTNYDDVLERRLADVRLPYHLLSYQADDPDRGLFYHRTPDDRLRIIERPRSIRKLADGFVIVKLNGGFDRQRRIPESYSTTRLDYWYLAARIPDVFPAAVQQTLSANPLLFIGSGLSAPDIEALVRFAHKEHPGPRSWAITLKDSGIEYWQQCGVEIIRQPLQLYVNELRACLAGSGALGLVARAESDASAPTAPQMERSARTKSRVRLRKV